ncbi:hypothetical protein Tco_0282498, partial [Tanacetum coccineum]
SLGELEADAVTLLKRIQKFSLAQDIEARVAVHIFNRISFAIAKGVRAQIVSRLLSNLLEDHTSDWLRAVPISGLGQTMNTCSRVFNGDIYGDHDVSCASIVGIKHRHNVVRDTLVDICYCSGISAGKEVDIGLDGGIFAFDANWDDKFRVGRVVIDVAQRKRGKYMAKCAAIGYGFLLFCFSSLGELEADAVTLLKRIRKFSMAQDIGARAAVHIFNRISFAIAKRARKIYIELGSTSGIRACRETLNDDTPPPPPIQTPVVTQTPHTMSTIKLHILKKGEYDLWAIKMEHYLAHIEYPIWEVIQKGNGPVSVSTDTNGVIKVLPPKTAEEILAKERERKARTTLLMALPEDHLAKFHKMTDTKEM